MEDASPLEQVAGFQKQEITEALGAVVKAGGRSQAKEQWLFKFPNGYGASVIRGPYTYGGPDGLLELAVLGPNGDLDYSTPVTSDVEGRLTIGEVLILLDRIRALPKAEWKAFMSDEWVTVPILNGHDALRVIGEMRISLETAKLLASGLFKLAPGVVVWAPELIGLKEMSLVPDPNGTDVAAEVRRIAKMADDARQTPPADADRQ